MRRIVMTASLLVLAACGAGAAPNAEPTTTVDHLTHLADHENVDLASQLAPVAGYTYVDPPDNEVAASLELLHGIEARAGRDGFFAAMGFHGVVADDEAENHSHTASDGWEVGYLSLMQFELAPPAGVESSADYFAALFDHDVEGPERLELAGTHVFKFVDRESINSRYQYFWIRHGIQGQFDGADAPSMERWLPKYLALPVLSPGEDTRLAERLVPVDGFVYVNAPRLEDFDDALVTAFGDVPSVIHKIADDGGSIGSLALVEVRGPLLADDAADAFVSAMGLTGTPSAEQMAGGVRVMTLDLEDGMRLWVWSSGDIVAVVGAEAGPGEVFVEGLLAGWSEQGLA